MTEDLFVKFKTLGQVVRRSHMDKDSARRSGHLTQRDQCRPVTFLKQLSPLGLTVRYRPGPEHRAFPHYLQTVGFGFEVRAERRSTRAQPPREHLGTDNLHCKSVLLAVYGGLKTSVCWREREREQQTAKVTAFE